MAPLARRTWAQLATEATQRLKGITYTGFDARVQHWLYQGYFWLCTTYGHFELDTTVTGALSTANNQVDLTAETPDLWIVFGMSIKAVASPNAPLQPLQLRNAHEIFSQYRAVSGRPERFTRFGTKLYLDKLPDAAYPYELYYRRFPTAPDFSGSATPDVTADCEEAILSAAVAMAAGRLSMLELQAGESNMLQTWQAGQVRPQLAAGDLPDRPLSPVANTTHQGAQG